MDVEQLARQLLDGQLSLDRFLSQIAQSHSVSMNEVTLDVDRRRRCGFPEVIYGEGKSVETIRRIVEQLLERDEPVLATRVDEEKGRALGEAFPEAEYNESARTFRISPPVDESRVRRVAVISAGTSDLRVSEEVCETLRWMGVPLVLIQDVGVAGPHRLPAQLDKIQGASAVVVVAGMEGALPSVVGGYVNCPVVAVPTSVGYGAAFGGLAALLGMLNSCASNVTVVNIDAGFKGGYVAGMIAHGAAEESCE